MKIKKTLAVVGLTILFSALMSLSAFADSADSANAGVRMVPQGKYDTTNQILTMKVQMKLPADSNGVTSFANFISYDETKLQLVQYDNIGTAVTSDGSINETASNYASPVVDVRLTDTAGTEYGVFDASLYSASGNSRSIFKVTLMTSITGTVEDPAAAQNNTNWQDVYSVKFKILGTGADAEDAPETLLTADSLRFVDTTEDAANLTASGFGLNWVSFFDIQTGGEQFVSGWTGDGARPTDAYPDMSVEGSNSVETVNNGVTVTGVVNSYKPANGVTVTFEGDAGTFSGGINPDATLPTTQSNEQEFMVESVLAGTYTVTISKVGHVDTIITGVVVAEDNLSFTTHTNASIQKVVLKAGDFSNPKDNQINLTDFLALAGKFDTYSEGALEDINGDNQINLTDFLAFSANMDQGVTNLTW